MAGREELKIVGLKIGGMLADFGVTIGGFRVSLTN
jgi:hypothetical protein